MVIKNLSDIKRHKEIIDSYLHGYNLKKICEHFKITHNELLALIEYYHIPYDHSILAKSSLRGSLSIFLSDTHMASELDRLDYIHETYDFAVKNGIRDVVHLGDVLQAGDHPVRIELQDPDRQMDYFEENYPHRKGVRSHLLFGNHDLKILDKNYRYMKVIKAHKDIDVLGFRIAYLNWGKHLISAYHETHHYHLNIPNARTDLHVEGHKHAFSARGKCVSVPSLSDDMKHYAGAISEPGFLVGEQNKDSIKLYLMSFEGDRLHSKGKVYERHYR